MAYDINGMSDYTKSNGQIIIQDIVLGSQSINFDSVTVQEGIKYKEKVIDVAVGDTVIQSTNNDPSTLVYSGSTKTVDVDVEVVELGMKEKYTPNELNKKVNSVLQKAGSSPENPLPASEIILEMKGKDVSRKNDLAFWQGVKADDKVDGIVTILTNAPTGTTAPYVAGSVSGLTSTTAISHVESFIKNTIAKFPAWAEKGFYLHMSPAQYSTYFRTLFGLNGVVTNQTVNTSAMAESFIIPGTNITVYSTRGLTGKNNLIATRSGNLIWGCDLKGEDEYLKLEYLNESLVWRLMGVWKLGPQIARTAEVSWTK